MALTHFVKAARKVAGKCERCLVDILPGMSYKWVAIKPPGSHPSIKRVRCGGCPDWHVWDYSVSISAQCKRIIHNTEKTMRYEKWIRTERDARTVMVWAGDEALMLAQKRKASAEQTLFVFMGDNFQTKRFFREAEQLQAWSSRCRRWRPPPLPEPELTDCELCAAKLADLTMGGLPDCMECGGAGQYVPETPNDEQLIEWRAECADSALETLETCPL